MSTSFSELYGDLSSISLPVACVFNPSGLALNQVVDSDLVLGQKLFADSVEHIVDLSSLGTLGLEHLSEWSSSLCHPQIIVLVFLHGLNDTLHRLEKLEDVLVSSLAQSVLGANRDDRTVFW